MKSRVGLSPKQATEELLQGQSMELLKKLHLLTRHGSLNADARRKLKQVNHFMGLLKPLCEDILKTTEAPVVVDVGAGKAYLGFMLFQYFPELSRRSFLYSIENRQDLVDRGEKLASEMGLDRMKFISSQIAEARVPEKIHLVTALHACDTATDDAIVLGLRAQANYIAVVPCCQAELAQILSPQRGSGLNPLWRHGLHRREFGAHLTNVLRSLVLEAAGYSVAVTELVGWEHSLKNELLLARKVQGQNSRARRELETLVNEIGVKPKLVREFLN